MTNCLCCVYWMLHIEGLVQRWGTMFDDRGSVCLMEVIIGSDRSQIDLKSWNLQSGGLKRSKVIMTFKI